MLNNSIHTLQAQNKQQLALIQDQHTQISHLETLLAQERQQTLKQSRQEDNLQFT